MVYEARQSRGLHFALAGVVLALSAVFKVLDLGFRKVTELHWGDEAEEVVVAERPVGSFSRQLFLGETLDSERIEASCDNGVLTLRIPVAEAAKPRKVSISSGGGQSAISAQSTES